MKFDLLISNGTVITEQGQIYCDLAINDGHIAAIGHHMPDMAIEHISANGLIVMPGLVDPHCHFREPGPEEEEDYYTGTKAAAAGGITTVLEQPVDTPPTTTIKRFSEKLDCVKPKSVVDFALWAGVVPDNLDEL